MVQIFAYCEHMQIVRKLDRMKRLPKITQFFLTWQVFVYYHAPDVPVNMAASYLFIALMVKMYAAI